MCLAYGRLMKELIISARGQQAVNAVTNIHSSGFQIAKLVSRPSHRPVFDSLWYAKTEQWEGLGTRLVNLQTQTHTSPVK